MHVVMMVAPYSGGMGSDNSDAGAGGLGSGFAGGGGGGGADKLWWYGWKWWRIEDKVSPPYFQIKDFTIWFLWWRRWW